VLAKLKNKALAARRAEAIAAMVRITTGVRRHGRRGSDARCGQWTRRDGACSVFLLNSPIGL